MLKRGIVMNFRYKVMQFMSGRYGIDSLFYALFISAAVLSVVNCFVRQFWLQIIVYALVIYAIFRVMSRNTEKRRCENQAFNRVAVKFKEKKNTYRQHKADRTHIYKKCPNCHAVLRLPRRKGKRTTVCPKCSKEFKVRVFKA